LQSRKILPGLSLVIDMDNKEKAICKQYSKRDKNGKVHCSDCPLVIDKTACVCKKVLEDSRN
jgi:hypothetical protein